MNVYPQDLGTVIGEEIRSQRGPEDERPSVISAQTSAMVFLVSLTGTILSALLRWPIGWLLLFVTIIAASLYITAALKSYDKEETEEPLIEYEVGFLREGIQDPLARDYLALVRTILAVPSPQSVAAEQELRGAVHALGVAIESLPLHGREVTTEDPQGLRAEAGQLAAEAQNESDPVICASRQRRAESLLRRADTATKTVILLRRNQALREEVAEQINALRTNLNAFSVGGEQSVHELASLAASIQSVTVEANAITSARAEIDALLNAPAAATTTAEASQPLHSGRN